MSRMLRKQRNGRIEKHPVLEFDRSKKVTIYFNGKPITAYEGETIAASLYAAGIKIFSRSLKFHRPRGFFCAIGKCASCMMRVDGRPNVKTCTEYVNEGMKIETQTGFPNANFDILSIIDYIYKKKFDYNRMFIRPAFMASLYQKIVRKFAGIGRLEDKDTPAKPIKKSEILETDVAIVGGGPAGLSAAIYAARSGAKVIVIDENKKLGGQLIKQTHRFFGSKEYYAGERGIYIAEILINETKSLQNITILDGATVFGVYPNKVLGIVKDNGLIEIKPKTLIFATGATEKTLIFENWDLPGVYGAGGVQTLMNVYGVLPGKRGLMLGSGNVGVIVTYHLLQAGVEVAAVVDPLPKIGGYAVHAAIVSRFGVPFLPSHMVKRALGRKYVTGAIVCKLDEKWNPIEGSERVIDCDFICIATGLKPANELLFQAGCKMKYIPELGGYVPLRTKYQETSVSGIFVVGDTAGIEEASSAMLTGRIAGLSAAISLGYGPEKEQKLRKLREDNYRSLCELRNGHFGERIRKVEEKILLENYI